MAKIGDIEHALRWAFREELPKDQAVRKSAWDIVTSYCALGTRIDVSRGGWDALGFTPGDPHEDAITIGRAVWALPRKQCITEIDEIRALVPDAPLLTFLGEKAVRDHTWNWPAMVISSAVQGAPPVWDLGPMIPRKVLGQKGQPLLVGKCYGKDRYSDGAFVPLEIRDPSVVEVMMARAYYWVWWSALVALIQELDGKLKEHTLTGPAAPANPWVTGVSAPPVILPSNQPMEPAPRAVVRPRALRGPAPHRLGKAVGPSKSIMIEPPAPPCQRPDA